MIGTGFGVDFFSGDVIEYAQTVGSVAKTVGILTFRVFINFRVDIPLLSFFVPFPWHLFTMIKFLVRHPYGYREAHLSSWSPATSMGIESYNPGGPCWEVISF